MQRRHKIGVTVQNRRQAQIVAPRPIRTILERVFDEEQRRHRTQCVQVLW